MIHDFYHNTRGEIKELEARIKNLDTDMQDMEEKHRTEIKIYIQKVKHLEYEHEIQQTNVKNDAEKFMKKEEGDRTEKESEF